MQLLATVWDEIGPTGQKISKLFLFNATLLAVLLTIGGILFHQELGKSALDVRPWTMLAYSHYVMPQKIRFFWFMYTVLPFAMTGWIAYLQIWSSLPSNRLNTKWMTYFEAKRANICNDRGIVLGKKWGEYLTLLGWEHVLCFAPSGTGKSTAIAIPNLFAWDDSCICLDIKKELYKTTAKYRVSQGHKCYLWDPGNPEGSKHCFNPLDMVSKDKYQRINDLQKLAFLIFPDRPNVDPLWTAGPRDLFVAVALYVLDSPKLASTLGEISRLLRCKLDIESFINKEVNENPELDNICVRNFNAFITMPDKTRGGVQAAFYAGLELFENPYVDKATSKSDFDIRNIRKETTTIYVGISNDNLARLAPLMNMFFQQVVDTLTQKEPDPNQEPYGVLMLLDEFPALGEMPIFKKNIGLMRSYKVRLLMLIQDISQLYDLYGREGAKSFLNVRARVAFTQNGFESAKYISDLMGEKTVKKRSRSTKGSVWASSQSESDERVPFMPPQNILRLPERQSLILIQGENPIKANKVVWFKDRGFRDLDKKELAK